MELTEARTRGYRRFAGILAMAAFLPMLTGCARLFGWDIHAPGILSQNFYQQIQPVSDRVALYLPPRLTEYISQDKGTRFSDPQTYHVGEAVTPLLIEGFQQAFGEFVSLETEPEPAVLQQYGIPYLVVVDLKSFRNLKTYKAQALVLETDVGIYDRNMNLLARFDAKGTSDAQKVFAKKGGPEVNMNAALENNVLVIIQFVQDYIASHRANPA